LIPIGIMQGRLSPPLADRLQGFPWQTWEQEFERAAALGFDCIEWIFEDADWEQNPLWTDEGVRRINELQRQSGVAIRSVCADYFMPHPLFRGSPAERAQSGAVLERLVERASLVGARLILMPVLEIAEIQSNEEAEQLYSALHKHLAPEPVNSVRVGLEAELEGAAYRALSPAPTTHSSALTMTPGTTPRRAMTSPLVVASSGICWAAYT
jgi:L-ribulose-5-phosphate 3-epimerase